MAKIYKYQFDITDTVTIDMPIGSQVMSFDSQDNKPTLWALVEPEAEIEERTFYLFGTGHNVPDNFDASDHIGTIQINGLVWHLFE